MARRRPPELRRAATATGIDKRGEGSLVWSRREIYLGARLGSWTQAAVRVSRHEGHGVRRRMGPCKTQRVQFMVAVDRRLGWSSALMQLPLFGHAAAP